ncbi:MAG: hypothetical protein O3C21_19740 [Verrucomicrobia bacterium]|nr:hypothetical protein [Verrucomicrobiota bacterium]
MFVRTQTLSKYPNESQTKNARTRIQGPHGARSAQRHQSYPADRAGQEWWQKSLEAAKDLQDGKEVGRIGYYAPDMIIKGNLIDSITGFGFLFAKGQ